MLQHLALAPSITPHAACPASVSTETWAQILMMTVIITQRGLLKSTESQKVLSDTWGFSCYVPISHVTPNPDCNPSQRPGIIYLVVWYTRHDSGWSTIIKERLKQLYIMLKHSLFPPQTDGPGLQAALDRLNHDSHHI